MSHHPPKVDLSKQINIPKITYDQLKTKYEIHHPKLGSGSFGEVYKITLKSDPNKAFALKQIQKAKIKTQQEAEQLYRELVIQSQLKHPNCLRLLEAYDTDQAYYLVLELASGGSLFETVSKKNGLDEDTARKFLHQIVDGIAYMHSMNIAHRDLKLENILLCGPTDQMAKHPSGVARVVLCDFGFSKSLGMGNLTTALGTPEYVAPDILDALMKTKPGHHTVSYGLPADYWSLGCIAFTMFAGRYAFDNSQGNDHLYSLIRHGTYRMSSRIPEGAADLIKNMLVVDPTKRITVKDIYKHPWFQVGYIPLQAPGSPSSPPHGTAPPAASTTATGAAASTSATKEVSKAVAAQQQATAEHQKDAEAIAKTAP